MSNIKTLNPEAEMSRQDQALILNLGAARGLQEVVKSNLGPKGTIKMLVSGSGDIKLTKDGSVLLREMHIQHPTANLIARSATSQDDMTGDGTTSIVVLIGELLKQSQQYLNEGVHPRALVDGFEAAKECALRFLDEYKERRSPADYFAVAQTALRTKISPASFADQIARIVVDAVEIIKADVVGNTIDLFMVEIMTMKHRMACETKLVRGLVLDHGTRHHDMPKRVENAYILTCNVSMEYEKSEVNSSLTYSSAEQRVKLAAAERAFCDATVARAIALQDELRRKDPGAHLVVVNQKGIDPPSLQAFADAGIMALRRAKRRNMERLTLACGGTPLNTLEGASIDALGHADLVYEQVIGEEKYTFIEGVKFPRSCTVLIKGADDQSIAQVKDAVRDGLRAVKTAIDDGDALVPGAGAFEIAAAAEVLAKAVPAVHGKAKLGAEAFAKALLVIPKTLAGNAGHDPTDTTFAAQDALAEQKKRADKKVSPVGINLEDGKPFNPVEAGIWDNVCVKKSIIQSATVVAEQLLLVDVVMRAGKSGGGGQAAPGMQLE